MRFGEHDVAFGIERGLVDVEIARDLAHQHDAGVDRRRIVLGHVEHVDGLRRLRVGVGVGTERQTEALQLAHHVAVGDMLRTAEGHVFEHVCDALLVVAFHQRADIHAQPNRQRAFGRGVAADRVAHAVGAACRSAHPDRPADRSSAAATA